MNKCYDQGLNSLFKPEFNYELCDGCAQCVRECSFNEIKIILKNGKKLPAANQSSCGACHRCELTCPKRAITIVDRPFPLRANKLWDYKSVNRVHLQAASGAVILTGMGADNDLPNYFDRITFNACQVTNPSIDPQREPMETTTFLGRREVSYSNSKDQKQQHLIEIDLPLVFGPMSYGSISLNLQKALAKVAMKKNILWYSGEGGLHKDLYDYASRAVLQVASGRFGVSPEYLRLGGAYQIKIGQGAKPGIGGHLPGEKVLPGISETRMIPLHSDAISPAPQHDIYSIEDLKLLIHALKEATGYKPVCVKIAAVHNVAAIATGVVHAGADMIYIDGFRGGSGATPSIVRDNVGIPIELALAVVDERLRNEGIRHQASIIAAGGIRNSADVMKCIALGADAVAIGTAALVACGCHMCQRCHSGKCPWGITTNEESLLKRLDVEWAEERLRNLVEGWHHEMQELMGLNGIYDMGSFRGNRLLLRGVGLNDKELEILGIKHAGE
ncbi:glutamate synthase-related protein [Desulfitibacter alkalitolerans]|uniref:glutamate synthase-related protein n=1 Tax=Desulfitibacter alkalitolerans TaxID=264641 RepID=UPI00054FD742|nr:glutamate synthase-related protein [Desulfitibacter alkalitolerans]